eukprot:1859973-Amphidinium_carterae.3
MPLGRLGAGKVIIGIGGRRGTIRHDGMPSPHRSRGNIRVNDWESELRQWKDEFVTNSSVWGVSNNGFSWAGSLHCDSVAHAGAKGNPPSRSAMCELLTMWACVMNPCLGSFHRAHVREAVVHVIGMAWDARVMGKLQSIPSSV